ncbi:pre-rRNA 2'-O-ribose RNA methyltransferase FTSJ3-like [Terrapene carolina triunguis]|uniref:pre-rRNA 2'-O-ribose RNA methyltransferase FTSJ3-like n=1 Tax=Terrapene triunguis TaxID=2587831 RepID=UPI001156BA46|nr:pre-rRNA 2'-O-ribose RNA methyltransferase FTSJ3-like [Terrapene carolina triunguis]
MRRSALRNNGQNGPFYVSLLGVDLVPIKPIPNVVTLQEDITTEKCRQAVRKELQTWKVDVVLNDGAPNVGASWVHDAYSQANLTLMALKLACEFLSKGGWFITKVFRSRDYQPLLWIFQQLFRKVQATKPQASRNESAEIFVVCQGYLSPDKIDSKFFDPKFAFKEVEIQAKSVSELVTKKKPKAEGYAEGDTTLYHRFTLMDFLKAPNPVDFLSKANEITLGDSELERHSATTEELRQCCRDIRVLGRKELRALLNWRTKLRRFMARKLKEQAKELDISLSSGEEEEGGEEEAVKTSGAAGDGAAEEEEMELRLAELKAEEVAELKRKKKKILKEQRKQRERIELKMDLPGVSIADEGETGMFSLRTIGKTRLLNEVARGDMASADAFLEAPHEDDDVAFSEQDDADDVSLASDLDSDELADIEERLQEAKRGLGPKRGTFQQPAEEEEEENPLLVPLEEKSVLEERQTNLWFGKEVFAGIEDDVDEALEISQAQVLSERKEPPPGERGPAKRGRAPGFPEGSRPAPGCPSSPRGWGPWEAGFPLIRCDAPPSCELPCGPPVHLTHWPCLSHPGNMKGKGQKKLPPSQEAAAVEVGPRAAVGAGPSEDQGGGSSGEEDSDSSSDEERETSQKGRKRALAEPGGFEVVPIEDPVKRARVLDAEGLALGSVIATSRKAKRDLIDNSFNRYAFNEEEGELPEWFQQEEQQHRRKQLPLDRQTVEEYRQRWRQINARPIKKVAEAKARKKRRLLKKMEQMKKKAEAVVSTVDISEREKVAQLRSIYKKAGLGKEKREVTYLVAKKGVGRRVRRPAGVKGHFKVVDSRMKKDMRAQKGKEKTRRRRK